MKTIFKNGRIHTMNGGEIVDSISVEDGRIVSDDYVPEDGRIREVDLCKKTVIPAFHDSHQHFLCYATDKEISLMRNLWQIWSISLKNI